MSWNRNPIQQVAVYPPRIERVPTVGVNVLFAEKCTYLPTYLYNKILLPIYGQDFWSDTTKAARRSIGIRVKHLRRFLSNSPWPPSRLNIRTTIYLDIYVYTRILYKTTTC